MTVSHVRNGHGKIDLKKNNLSVPKKYHDRPGGKTEISLGAEPFECGARPSVTLAGPRTW